MNTDGGHSYPSTHARFVKFASNRVSTSYVLLKAASSMPQEPDVRFSVEGE